MFGIRDCVSIFDAKGVYLFGSSNSMEIRSGKKTPLLPLDSEDTRELTLTIAGNKHLFKGDIRAIYDNKGRCFAYAETLTDITNKTRLKERELELLHIRRKMNLDSLKTRMIGESKAMHPVFDTIGRCAEVDSSVLIVGETGVGKELAAKAVHEQSHRNNKPFVGINCGALPETLLESELFGHIKGSFTGSIKDRLGLFREADGGTLFLDEIGDLNRSLQVKLLRALQEKEVRPVGGDRSYPVDVRIISATNLDLKEMVEKREFRHDLFYRIAVIPLQIPPLRDRPDDIIRLAEYFIKKYQKKNRSQLKSLNSSSAGLLCEYHWPGNIRELENAIEHGLAMARGQVLTPDCLPKSIVDSELNSAKASESVFDTSLSMKKAVLEAEEKQTIIEALLGLNGNQTQAARQLGISRVTLWRKIRKYKIKAEFQ